MRMHMLRMPAGDKTHDSHPARACMTMAFSGSPAAMSWKFFTLASFTRPRKLRHQQCRLSFQCGGLFSSSTPPARPPAPPSCRSAPQDLEFMPKLGYRGKT